MNAISFLPSFILFFLCFLMDVDTYLKEGKKFKGCIFYFLSSLFFFLFFLKQTPLLD